MLVMRKLPNFSAFDDMHVRPRLCSMPISAAFSTCWGVPPVTAARPAAAIEQATPTSP
jgi:hypothetical protein